VKLRREAGACPAAAVCSDAIVPAVTLLLWTFGAVVVV